MSTRDFIRSILTSFVISTMLLFFSCASQDRVEEDPMAALGSETSEPSLDGGDDALLGLEGGDPLADLGGEAIPTEDIPMEEALAGMEGDPLMADLGAEGGGDPLLDDLGADPAGADPLLADPAGENLGLPSEEELAMSADNQAPSADLPPDTDLNQTFGGGELAQGDPDLNLGEVLGLPSDKELEEAAALEQQAQQMPEGGDLLGGMDLEAGYGTPAPQGTPRAWSGVSSIPTIPAEAFEKNGTLLNRFYFLRAGDTPESVSQLLYGSDGRASELKAWNGGRWRTGKLIFYSSPFESQDRQIRSFYQERNVPPEQVTVQRGDTLSLIAKNRLGDFRSWKEIAVVNGLSSADAISPGQPLAVYPADLTPYGGAAGGNLAQAEPPTPPSPSYEEPTAAAPPPSPPSFSTEPQVQFAPPPPVQQRIKQRNAPTAPDSGFSLGRLIQQNLFFILVGGGILVLLGALLAVNKRRRAQQSDELGDDDIFNNQMQ